MARRLTLDAVALSASSATGQLVMAGVLALAGRALGPSGLATVAVALSVASFLSGVTDFGANYLMLREVSAERLSRSGFRHQIWSKLMVCLAIAGVLVLGGLFVKSSSFSGAGTAVVYWAISWSQALSIGTRAADRNRLLALAVISDRCLMAATFVGALLILRIDAAVSFFLAYGVGGAVDCIVCIFATPRDLRPEPSRPTLAPWRGAQYFGLSTIAQNAAALDTTIASALGGAAVAGSYGGVNRWTQPIGLATTAFTTALFPIASRGRDARAVWIQIRGSLWMPAVAVLAAALMGLVAPRLVPAVLGPNFSSAVPALQWLCASAALGTINQVASIMLQARRRERAVARTMVAGVAAQLALLVPLVPRFGSTGVAMSAALSQMVYLVGFVLVARPSRVYQTIRGGS